MDILSSPRTCTSLSRNPITRAYTCLYSRVRSCLPASANCSASAASLTSQPLRWQNSKSAAVLSLTVLPLLANVSAIGSSSAHTCLRISSSSGIYSGFSLREWLTHFSRHLLLPRIPRARTWFSRRSMSATGMPDIPVFSMRNMLSYE